MSEMPTLGEPPKKSPVVPVAIAAVVVGCVAGGLFWLKNRSAPPSAEPPPLNAAPAVAEAPALAAPPGGATPTPTDLAPSLAPSLGPPRAGSASAVSGATAEKSGMRAFQVKINGPLESAIINSEGKEHGTPLTQVISRSLVWWLRVPQDLLKGDTLSAVYETREGQEPVVHAVRFESRKLGKTFEAFRFKPAGDGFAHAFQADFTELEERLVDAPVSSYEQITSLLRDGRKHKGVDFKTPVGTEVKATFDCVVTRKNWNFRGNGNAVEVQESGGQGRTALFLHLSELPKSLMVGQRIKRGETFAKSGNSGRSFAPHLHYQLMSGSKVIDPFSSHKTTRLSLPAGDRPAFEKRVAELKALIPAAQLAGG